MHVDELGDGIRGEAHPHGVDDLLDEHSRVGADDMAAKDFVGVVLLPDTAHQITLPEVL